MALYWSLPSDGGASAVPLAQAADRLGYAGLLVPAGGAEALAAGLLPLAPGLQFLVALRPEAADPAPGAPESPRLWRQVQAGRAAQPVPLYCEGASPQAVALAAEQAGTFFCTAAAPAALARQLAQLRELAAQRGRTLGFGIRLSLVLRGSEEQARREAQALPQAAPALAGTARSVAARLGDYAALGLRSFVFSSAAPLEDLQRFAEQVFPLLPPHLLRRRGSAFPGSVARPESEGAFA